MAAKIYQAHKLKSLPARHVALWRHLGGEVTLPHTRGRTIARVYTKKKAPPIGFGGAFGVLEGGFGHSITLFS